MATAEPPRPVPHRIGAFVVITATTLVFLGRAASAGVVLPDRLKTQDIYEKLDPRAYSWDFAAGADTFLKDHWRTTVTASTDSVTLDGEHLNVPEGSGPHRGDSDPNPNKLHKTVSDLARPGGADRRQISGGTQLEHPRQRGKPHFDIWRWDVVLNGPDVPGQVAPAVIRIGGTHLPDNIGPFMWSVRNFTDLELPFKLFASYPDPPGNPTEPFKDSRILAGQHLSDKVPSHDNGTPKNSRDDVAPTDYRMVIESRRSPLRLSDTTLMFLVQNGDGLYEALELAAGVLALSEGGFLVPGLISDTVDLFIGVDLTQWTAFSPMFRPGDVFEFVDGVNAALPGMLVGRSPIFLDPLTGLRTAIPYTGPAEVIAGIDGSVAEPVTSLLVVLGLSGALGLRRLVI